MKSTGNKFVEKAALPESLEKYFWDCDFSELDFEKHQRFIVERILEYGNDAAMTWLLQNTDESTIKTVVANSRNLSEKTKNFWQIMLS